jgi:hypothetical protein
MFSNLTQGAGIFSAPFYYFIPVVNLFFDFKGLLERGIRLQ